MSDLHPYPADFEGSGMTTGVVSVWRIALLEAGVFLGAVRDRVVIGCGLFKVARLTAFDSAGLLDAFFLAVLLWRSFDLVRLLGTDGLRADALNGRPWALRDRGSFGRTLRERIDASGRTRSGLLPGSRSRYFRVLPCPTRPLRSRNSSLPFRAHRPSFGQAELAWIEAGCLVLGTL